MNTLIPAAAAGILLVVTFAVVLISGARARMPVGKARAVRIVIAILGAFFITMLGYVFFFFGMHRTTAVQTTLAFLGVPFLQSIVYFNLSVSDIWVHVALILGIASWAVILYCLLSMARIPGQRQAAEAQRQGP